MSGWEVGDLALCVESGTQTRSGHIYTVCEIWGQVLHFSELMHSEEHRARWSLASRFRKIRPDQHEDCEPEFVTLLQRIKRPAKQGEAA